MRRRNTGHWGWADRPQTITRTQLDGSSTTHACLSGDPEPRPRVRVGPQMDGVQCCEWRRSEAAALSGTAHRAPRASASCGDPRADAQERERVCGI